MWIIVRLLIGIALLAVVEFYFIKKTNLTVKRIFPTFYLNRFPLIRKIFLIWMNLYPLILIGIFVYFSISGNYVSSPESKIIDYLFIYPFWIFFILMIQTTLYFLLLDIIKPIASLFLRKQKELFVKIEAVVILTIIGFFIIYIPIRVIYDYNEVSIRIVDYKKTDLPEALNEFKIAFISDIQADHYTDKGRLENFINKVNSLNPDLVLIAGDMITTGPGYINVSAEEVGKLKSTYGVYSCVGDHDNWAYRNDYTRSLREIRKALEEKNIKMVDNGRMKINVAGADIGITFITNTYVGRVPDDVLDSLSSNSSGAFKIFLTHQPRPYLIDAAKKNHFDLFLAGHTHGGQITFVFPFIQLTPTLFETKYIKGDFWFDDLSATDSQAGMLMIVTRGLGMSLAPIRYNSTPEVILIALRNGS